jgi:hypothetical protein
LFVSSEHGIRLYTEVVLLAIRTWAKAGASNPEGPRQAGVGSRRLLQAGMAKGGDVEDTAGSRMPGGRIGEAALSLLGVPIDQPCPSSEARFPDGAAFRIEIPSVEGPEAMKAVFEEADQLGVVVNRVSQGSGAMLLRRRELAEMARMGADRGAEVSLFVGPREEWDLGASSRSSDGPGLAGQLRGLRQLRYAIDDVLRAVEVGIRGFLVADLGLLELLVALQRSGEIPADVVWKLSAVAAPSNPVAFRLYERLGASTVNVPSDMTLAQLAEVRALSDLPIDLYVESPDGTGGVVRGHELAEIVMTAAPLYAKFGLRNARGVYPAGLHLATEVSLLARAKVRRASVALEWAARAGCELAQSQPGAKGLGVPCP